MSDKKTPPTPGDGDQGEQKMPATATTSPKIQKDAAASAEALLQSLVINSDEMPWRYSTRLSGLQPGRVFAVDLGDVGSAFRRTFVRGQKEEELALENERLRKQLAEQTRVAVEADRKSGQQEQELLRLRRVFDDYQTTQRLSYVVNRIRPEARDVLLNSASLQRAFLAGGVCKAFVMSIDIRRSTDLMLKARTPELYAGFILKLCSELTEIVVKHNGVFDKFTGDGVLAFFPDFYSGDDAGLSAVAAAAEAHALFRDHYRASRGCFVSVLSDVGLGIGVDYGSVHLVNIGDGLTVVGTPVVYACRMASAPAGTTLLNEPAYEEVFRRFSEFCTFHEAQLDVKHEGPHIAHSVTPNGKPRESGTPGWELLREQGDSDGEQPASK